MNYKSFVLALGVLLVMGPSVYAQKKAKNIVKGVDAAVSKRVPGTTGRAAGSAGRGLTRTVPGVAGGVTGRGIVETTTGVAAGSPAAGLLKDNPSALHPNVPKPVLPPAPAVRLPEAPVPRQAQRTVGGEKEYVGGIAGLELIQDAFREYFITNPEHATFIKAIVDVVYEVYSLDPTSWDIRLGVIDAVNNEAPSTVEGFPPNLTAKVVMQEAPEVMQSISVLTFREYINKHAMQFPDYGADESLDIIIHHTWRRLFADKLYQKEKEMLVNCYVDAANTDVIEEVLSETEEFILTHGRFPGIDKLTMQPQKLFGYVQGGGASKLSAEEIKEISLGMKAGIIVHAWPFSSGWSVTSQQAKQRILRLMEDGIIVK